MKVLVKKLFVKTILVTASPCFLASCGGGSSNSGGPSTPPSAPFPLFTTGIYSGTITDMADGQNIVGASETRQFSLEVRGNVAGGQQTRIAFRQFSGTSAILRDGSFSIPSGSFPIPITTRGGTVVTQCTGEFLFEGVFANNAVTGTLETTSEFVCDRPNYGPITITGTFEASPGAAKQSGNFTGFNVLTDHL